MLKDQTDSKVNMKKAKKPVVEEQTEKPVKRFGKKPVCEEPQETAKVQQQEEEDSDSSSSSDSESEENSQEEPSVM